jgi:hypothetical protein
MTTMPGRSNFPDGDGGTTPFCAYRGKDGNACFVGCLLTDAEAAPIDRMTQEQTGGSVRDAYKAQKLPDRLVPHVDLLARLQPIHDERRPDRWEDELRLFASKHGLNSDAINEAFSGR